MFTSYVKDSHTSRLELFFLFIEIWQHSVTSDLIPPTKLKRLSTTNTMIWTVLSTRCVLCLCVKLSRNVWSSTVSVSLDSGGMDTWINGLEDKQMTEWMNEWMDGWMDEWRNDGGMMDEW